jgi:SAM-dependent methyltransferase
MADAARLPFPAQSIDLTISNHSLEHIENLEDCLLEIGRVIKKDGSLYVAVPDASTITDKIYRWLAKGGGHVNPFASAAQLAQKIETTTGLRHTGTRTFMNEHNRRSKMPRRLLLLGGGLEFTLVLGTYLLRFADRLLKTRACVYGWAFHFGRLTDNASGQVWTNVCVRCGAGHPSQDLGNGLSYRCPQCGARNLQTNDRHYSHLVSDS